MEALKTIPFTRDPPKLEDFVVAEVVSFTDTIVDVVLPAYGRQAAIIPTSEIKVKRGKRVANYVKEGQELVAQVIRIDEAGRIDLSMKQVQEEDSRLAMSRYHRALKVHQIVGQACSYNLEKAKALYSQLHTLIRGPEFSFTDIYAYFESCLVEDSQAPSPEVQAAIRQRMPMPSYTVEKEVTLRYTDADGVGKITEQLDAWVAAGLQVYVVAPPKYKITATANSKAKAEQYIADAMA